MVDLGLGILKVNKWLESKEEKDTGINQVRYYFIYLNIDYLTIINKRLSTYIYLRRLKELSRYNKLEVLYLLSYISNYFIPLKDKKAFLLKKDIEDSDLIKGKNIRAISRIYWLIELKVLYYYIYRIKDSLLYYKLYKGKYKVDNIEIRFKLKLVVDIEFKLKKDIKIKILLKGIYTTIILNILYFKRKRPYKRQRIVDRLREDQSYTILLVGIKKGKEEAGNYKQRKPINLNNKIVFKAIIKKKHY
ncbi:hypothetical protein B0T21DRAFT_344555 [Apiosordaria backusii]|uniref:Uncharacterized protein n=1 Tax=Apiosordaria backusii TaxID=314023 RepID=A0AA40ES03_9PEZI|nr:hypothetical protein B0T21DRAFT_344555 [Apiosordaria backusii]